MPLRSLLFVLNSTIFNHSIQRSMKDPQDSIITIRNLIYGRALLIKMELEKHGIPCFITNAPACEGCVELHLDESGSAVAYELLEHLRGASGLEKELAIKQLRKVRRILVPIDFSERSIKAAHYALELARTLKAEIKLLHVWFDNSAEVFVFNEMFAFQTNLAPVMREMEETAQKQLTDVCDTLNQRIRLEKIKGVKIDYDLVRGASVGSILQIAVEYQPGLLVMGTRGKNRDSLQMIGSTTSKVMAKSKVPVMAVPENYNLSAFYKPHHIAYITHFDDHDFYALHQLIAFVKPFKAQVFCWHIKKESDAVIDRLRMKQLRDYFNATYSELTLECGLIEASDTVEAIETLVKEKEIDVIALILRRRNLLEQLLQPSLTKSLLYQSNIPMLVFSSDGVPE